MKLSLRTTAGLRTAVFALTCAGAATLVACGGSEPAPFLTLDGTRPLVIGHRGSAGYLPDHTLEGYRLAIQNGADFIEPDLVATKDGELIARHEPNITTTTDVASRAEFAARKTTRNVDGIAETGWFAGDFTLAEIKTLRAVQPLPERNQAFNGKYQIPTLREVLDLAKTEGTKAGRVVGVYPETKHPTYHLDANLKLEDRLLAVLGEYGYTKKDSPVIVQSFEVSNLQYLRTKTQVRLVQLVDGDDYDFKTGVVNYADATSQPATSVVADAHKAGLVVHPYTFRNEGKRLAFDYKGDPKNEYLQFYRLGVDGLFSDFADTAVAARATYLKELGR